MRPSVIAVLDRLPLSLQLVIDLKSCNKSNSRTSNATDDVCVPNIVCSRATTESTAHETTQSPSSLAPSIRTDAYLFSKPRKCFSKPMRYTF